MKDADAGCLGDGDDDLVRDWKPDIVMGNVAVAGAVKPLFNPPSVPSTLLTTFAVLWLLLLSACWTWPCRLGYVGLCWPEVRSRAGGVARAPISETRELDLLA